MVMRLLLTFFTLFAATLAADSQPVDASRELDYCARQTRRALHYLQPYEFNRMPRNIMPGQQRWNLRPAVPEEWCSGFWPGVLWMVYGHTGDHDVRKAAEGYTEAIAPIIAQRVYDHDLGFIVINSLLKGYEQTSSRRYRQLALQAADSLATLYNKKVGTLLSWPRHVKDYGGHNTIMDNMINLELLLWADSQTRGSSQRRKQGRSRYYDIAVSHADTTMRYHFRSDASCYHVAVYDTLTGRFLRGVTHQGYADWSMWSRGQAWAVYGYTMVYRYTRQQRFLDFACRVANTYLRRLVETSDDMVPLWDMDYPVEASTEKRTTDNLKHKDASAACVMASALIELDGYAPGHGYREMASQMLADLSSDRYQSRGNNVAFLMHSTGHHPAGTEIDASIVYADYYYIEALTRYLCTK